VKRKVCIVLSIRIHGRIHLGINDLHLSH
jgi:hypothetical protein